MTDILTNNATDIRYSMRNLEDVFSNPQMNMFDILKTV